MLHSYGTKPGIDFRPDPCACVLGLAWPDYGLPHFCSSVCVDNNTRKWKSGENGEGWPGNKAKIFLKLPVCVVISLPGLNAVCCLPVEHLQD